MTTPEKRMELKNKIEAAEQRNAGRSLGDHARDAREGVTSFVKEHPITTVAGGLAIGVLIASLVPGPGRRLRKKATARTAILGGVVADLVAKYGEQFIEGASNAAKAGQHRAVDIGSAIGSTARHLRHEAGDLASDAGFRTREAGERAARTFRNLRSRITN
ncbi:hypothetical protein GRI40_02250 [Altererythrobacter aerius]|uniref:Uncharacterized protein n=1 Tax=Tsuneonella aeria TaxID=1837929 RepID=A0A6I4TA01_9SPHN|nr:hypothetical protein [Tsuneonella aeria]MXO74042.1 hypothetical protein [Tsuneonella aeria]